AEAVDPEGRSTAFSFSQWLPVRIAFGLRWRYSARTLTAEAANLNSRSVLTSSKLTGNDGEIASCAANMPQLVRAAGQVLKTANLAFNQADTVLRTKRADRRPRARRGLW